MSSEMIAGRRPSRVPFPVKAFLVVGVLAVGIVLFLASLETTTHQPSETQVQAAVSALNQMSVGRDFDELSLASLVHEGHATSASAVALAQQLSDDDRQFAVELKDHDWPSPAHAAISTLISALDHQQSQLAAIGPTAATSTAVGLAEAGVLSAF